jgi:hypothetical protein
VRKEAWGSWLDQYREQLRAEGRSDEERRQEQNAVNPCYVARNQVMQEAIREAEAGNFEEVSARCVEASASGRQPTIRFGSCVSVSCLLLCAMCCAMSARKRPSWEPKQATSRRWSSFAQGLFAERLTGP